MDTNPLVSILPKPRQRRAHMVESLYGDQITFAIGCLVVVAIAALTTRRIGGEALWIITGALGVLAIVRLASFEIFRANDSHVARHPVFWKRLYAWLGIAHTGAIGLWVAAIFHARTDHSSELLSIMVSLGFLLGAQGRNFSSLSLVRLQCASCLVPGTVVICWHSPDWAFIMIGLVVAFYLSIVNTAKRTRRMFDRLLDISEENWRIAHLDPVTGLANGANLRSTVRRAVDERVPFAFLMIDIDGFRRVNETLGHVGGDEFLSLTAAALSRVAGPKALVARESSDSFVVLQLADHDERTPVALAREIVDALARPMAVNGVTMQRSCSLGVACFPRDGSSYESISHHAEMALDEARDLGGRQAMQFRPGTPDRAAERLRLENDLRRAIEDGQIEHFFQPIVTNPSHRVVGCEALARWNHPTLGAVSPIEFLPVAEDAGLMGQLTDQSFRFGCRAAATWPEHVALSVNLSPSQLCRPDLVPMIADALETAGISSTRLEIEITENLLLDGRADVIETLNRLRRLGVRLSLDDFGTGYSNLHQIALLPIHKIKLDKSFLKHRDADDRLVAVLTGVVRFIAPLGFDIVLEGIETPDQVEFAASQEGITLLQGFVFGAAMPASEIKDFLWNSLVPRQPDGITAFRGAAAMT